MGRIRSTNRAEVASTHKVEPDTERILINWGRWCAARNGGRWGGTGVFKLAKSGQHWDSLDAQQLAALPVDTDEAWRAEKIIGQPMFYPPYQTLLRGHYAFGHTPSVTCRELGIYRMSYDEELWKAACFFRNRFDRA